MMTQNYWSFFPFRNAGFYTAKIIQGVHKKRFRLLWKAIAPLRIIVVIKVRGDSESTVAELFVQYHNFPVAQQGATAI